MKIAVCGSAPSSRLLVPFGDMNFEIWACSPQNHDYPRVDAWFELHSLDRKYVPDNRVYYEKLRVHPRVYLSREDYRLPDAIVLDPKPFTAKYGNYFFTSSLAWMMAMAIEQKPEMIGIWGVDMSAADEYGYQRAGMHYFMQKATDAGIEIILPPQSDLAQGVPLYGYKEHWPMYWKIRTSAKELEDRVRIAGKQEEKAKIEKLILQGARDYLEYINNTWVTDTRHIDISAPSTGNLDTKPSTGFPISSIGLETPSETIPQSAVEELRPGIPVPSLTPTKSSRSKRTRKCSKPVNSGKGRISPAKGQML